MSAVTKHLMQIPKAERLESCFLQTALPFLLPNQKRQSTERKIWTKCV